MSTENIPKTFYLISLAIGLACLFGVVVWVFRYFKKKHKDSPYKNLVWILLIGFYGLVAEVFSYLSTEFQNVLYTYVKNITWTIFLFSIAYFINELINYHLWKKIFVKGKQGATTFVRSITSILIYLIFTLLIVAFIFKKEAALFATFVGGATVILGYSATDVIKEVFAGVALNVNPAFKIGDYLMIDEKYAKVIDINWRYVVLKDINSNNIFVPNTDMIHHVVYNLSNANDETRVCFSFFTHLQVEPKIISDLLIPALKKMPHLSKKDDFEDNVVIHTQKYHEYSIEYEVRLLITSFKYFYNMRTLAYNTIWRVLNENNIIFYVYKPFVQYDESIFTKSYIIPKSKGDS